jgi:hypothetical protein
LFRARLLWFLWSSWALGSCLFRFLLPWFLFLRLFLFRLFLLRARRLRLRCFSWPFSPCWRRLLFKLAFIFGSLAPLLDFLLVKDWPLNLAASFDVFRNGGFLCDLFNRSCSEPGPGRLGDGVNWRPYVDDNLFASAVKFPCLMAEIDIHYTSAVDNGRVIHYEHIGPYRSVEDTDLHKDELRRSKYHATRT